MRTYLTRWAGILTLMLGTAPLSAQDLGPPPWPTLPPPPQPVRHQFVPAKPAAPAPAPASIQDAPPLSPQSIAPAPAVQAAQVVVEKRGPDAVNFGQPFAYEILVRNAGSVTVTQVRVEDQLPAGAKYLGGDPVAEQSAGTLTWSVGALEAGGERRLRVELQPAGEGEQTSRAAVTFTAAAGLTTRVVRPMLKLAMTAPNQAVHGEQVAFQITISNPGTGPAHNVQLLDKLPEGLHHPQGDQIEATLGTLAPGESKTVTLKTTAVGGGAQVNEIVASADAVAEVTASATVNILQPKLTLTRGGPSKCRVKTEVVLDLELGNSGTAPAQNVVVTEVVPPGVDVIGSSDGGVFDAGQRTLTWRIGTLPPGAKKQVSYRAKATGLGDFVGRALAVAERNVEATGEHPLRVDGVPAVMLEVVDLDDPAEVGGELTYEIRVVNQGSVPITGIRLLAAVPDGLKLLEATGPVSYQSSGVQLAFEPLARLAVRADAVFRVRVRGVQPGDYRFKVQMQCDQLQSPVYKEESSRVYQD